MLTAAVFACILESGTVTCATLVPPPEFYVDPSTGRYPADEVTACEEDSTRLANYVLNQLLLDGHQVTVADGLCVGEGV